MPHAARTAQFTNATIKDAVRTLLISILTAFVVNAQALQKIDNVCPPEESDALGLTCSEDDPCPVYLELSSVDGFGSNIFVTGNLHTMDTTMSAVLLRSDDSGKTWSEPAKRVRAAALEQIQFADAQHGWASGMLLDPLPRDPFILSTVNGGQVWNKTPLSKDPNFGSIQQFWFDTAARGQMVIDRSQGKAGHYELYSSTDGGETWTLKSSSDAPARLPGAPSSDQASWRIVADKDAYRIERRAASSWESLTRFPIRAGECK
jgi:photosystem II stability/assembly factor-like uncharacterized protein